jgi:plasmid stabilization system protein ParE
VRTSFSVEALQDIVRLHSFLVEKSERAAARAIEEIRGSVRQISRFSQAGRPVLESPEPLRDWIVPFGSGAYVVRYRIGKDEITVLRIRHSLEAGF